ncbi:MAG: FtsX-like permease family protein [Acidobacteria bacterium]|nr:FtsX-like permease family protein [Acidobacteriota bacterium]
MARILAGLRERLRALRGQRFEAEFDEEVQFHLDQAAARNERRGMTPEDARRAARQAFGNQAVTSERVREETGVRLFQDLAHDVRHGFRGMRRRPVASAVIVLTVAVCIAANSAMFGVVYSILLRPLPFPDSDRLVQVFNAYPESGRPRASNSVPDRFDRRDFIESFEDVALYTEISYTVGAPGEGHHTFALDITPSFFSVLRATPALGRLLSEEIDDGAVPDVVVIGHKLWLADFAADPDVVGKTAFLDERPMTIVGVLPESFRFSTWDAQVFRPRFFSAEERSDAARHTGGFRMLARLVDGATVEEAQAEIDAFNEALVAGYAADLRTLVTDAGYHTVARGYLDDITRNVRGPFLLMWAGVVLLLVIGAANVVGILLVQARSRRDELAARMALGAGRQRILRQLVTESLLLTALGTGLGLFAARWALGLLGLLGLFEVYEIPRVDDVSLTPIVVVATVFAAGLLGTIAGSVPLFALRRGSALLGARRGNVGGAGGLQSLLVGGQIALAFVLVMCAGLLVTSLRNLAAVDPGFDPAGVVVHAISLPDVSYATPEAGVDYMERLVAEVTTVPGVANVGLTTHLPFSGAASRGPVVAEGAARAPGEAVILPFRSAVTPDYFLTMGMDMVAGRGFSSSDRDGAPRVAIIDRALADRLWPQGDAVGRRLWRSAEQGADEDAYTVIGIVNPIRQNALDEAIVSGAIYTSMLQHPSGFFRVAARLDGDRAVIWPALRARIDSVDEAVPLFWTDTMEGSVDGTLILRRTPMQVLTAFASLGLFLGMLGVYGVMAYSVGRRRREIGLRLAVGSTQTGIVRLLGREWLIVVGGGLVAGAIGALAATRALQGLLFETGPLDLGVAGITAACVAGAALLACVPPTRRALRVEPAVTLRDS